MDQAGSIEAGRSTATDRHQPDPVSAKESDLAAATMPLRADLARAARPASFMVGLVGIAVLIGWAADLPILKSVLPGYSAMKPTTALSFIMAALILALTARTANLPPSQPIQFAIGAGGRPPYRHRRAHAHRVWDPCRSRHRSPAVCGRGRPRRAVSGAHLADLGNQLRAVRHSYAAAAG